MLAHGPDEQLAQKRRWACQQARSRRVAAWHASSMASTASHAQRKARPAPAPRTLRLHSSSGARSGMLAGSRTASSSRCPSSTSITAVQQHHAAWVRHACSHARFDAGRVRPARLPACTELWTDMHAPTNLSACLGCKRQPELPGHADAGRRAHHAALTPAMTSRLVALARTKNLSNFPNAEAACTREAWAAGRRPA